MKQTFLIFFLSFSLIVSAQTEEQIYTELKSDNPTACPEKQAEYIGGINEFRNFITENLQFPDSKIKVRTVAEKTKKRKKLNPLKEIKALNLTITSTDTKYYSTTKNVLSPYPGTITIDPPPHIGARDLSTTIEFNTLVRFIIDEDGMVSNITIVRTQHDRGHITQSHLPLIQALETEIKRVISLSSGKWVAAEMNCEKVSVYVTIPVYWKHVVRDKYV
ncbi:MAG: energy transducer TonB [Dysgonamonadaceae bacterium]|jgi:hypothetical protein|nr:energy transducer TonB [Dysgonamonadaceae bacterium]